MSAYTENSLGKDESVVLEGKIHWSCLIPHIFLMFIFIGFFTIFRPLIMLFTTKLAFTNKRIIGKIGFVNTKSMDSPLNKINDVSISSGLFGKIFKYGNIKINTSSGTYFFKGIKKPQQFKTRLMAQIDQYDEDRIKKQAIEMASAIKDS